jgi:enterochelin esterase-like enzyme
MEIKYMANKFFLLLMNVMLCSTGFAQQAKVSSGTIQHFEKFASAYVAARSVDVWLPEGYSNKKKYAVLYMHDGQMLFDSNTTWNHADWQVDETVSRLLKNHLIKNCIVVGIYNTGEMRHADYLPQQPFEALTPAQQDTLYSNRRSNGQSVFNGHKIQSDKYLLFLVKELKPFIDSSFSTLPQQQHTFIAGSSMGGLISLYAICQYPDVFGGAACLSTHWTGIFQLEHNPFPAAMLKYLQTHLPSSQNHKIYFDHGTATLDTLYPAFQQQADWLMKQKGFKAKNWKTIIYTGKDHSEKAWAERFNVPLKFLLGK